MELKFRNRNLGGGTITSSNRTFMELKLKIAAKRGMGKVF